ncbi:ribosome silencing factor [candidate division TA06 bacterium]|uniref:Ribosomal silencing factor RsfS n=1 Tax=candidate division TA06 bacterium TaxID=2250710 RepID=A0A933I915_UNCT6|nr:ribosome silencing factor [candidate division TA06 bacterium]
MPVQKKTVRPQPKPDQVRELANEISRLALSKKAFDVSVLEIKELSSVADYFVMASGATDIQVRAICHAIEDGLRAKGIKPHHLEGMAGATWVLLDYVDVVVHVMQPRARDYYALEELWADAPKQEMKD